jgi:hypothetical protein
VAPAITRPEQRRGVSVFLLFFFANGHLRMKKDKLGHFLAGL